MPACCCRRAGKTMQKGAESMDSRECNDRAKRIGVALIRWALGMVFLVAGVSKFFRPIFYSLKNATIDNQRLTKGRIRCANTILPPFNFRSGFPNCRRNRNSSRFDRFQCVSNNLTPKQKSSALKSGLHFMQIVQPSDYFRPFP